MPEPTIKEAIKGKIRTAAHRIIDLLGFSNSFTFTGKLEINFKDGKLMDINETKRTKF